MTVQKILLILTAIFVIAAAWLFLNRAPTITNFPTQGTTIVALGDSLVEGVGATSGNDFVSIVSARIGEPIINMGVSGDTSTDGLRRIDEVLEADPRIVLVLLGGNDTLRRVPVETTFNALDTILTTLIEDGRAVVLLGAPGGLYGSQYERMFETLVDIHGVAYVPNVLKGLLSKPEYMSDPIHPNDAGYVIIADRVEPQLRQVITGPR